MRWSSPAPKGHGRLGLVPEVAASYTYNRDSVVDPQGNVEYRRGLADRWDLGGRIHGLGVAVDTRFLASRRESVETSVGIGAHVQTPPEKWTSLSGYQIALEPAFRVGVNVSRRSQLAFGLVPALVYTRDRASAVGGLSFPRRGLSLAPELTVAFDIGVSNGFHIVPQISATTFVGADSFLFTDDTTRFRAAIGFYF